ncbi:hypothetical protein DPEC_G00242610 [Dallia pectoralis]|uniref:Uncharacterized protein n=1 Tax=Dallia pectoralis TaxID=75939 RepID=A0ACC2FVC6_DALPE|nr:hypothetical protein DPEC_G00242610 [Dallia pectoralis]
MASPQDAEKQCHCVKVILRVTLFCRVLCSLDFRYLSPMVAEQSHVLALSTQHPPVGYRSDPRQDTNQTDAEGSPPLFRATGRGQKSHG